MLVGIKSYNTLISKAFCCKKPTLNTCLAVVKSEMEKRDNYFLI